MGYVSLFGFAIAAALFVVCALGNAMVPMIARRTGRSVSSVPLVGGVAGVIAVLLSPWNLPTWAIPLPLVLDLGTGLMVFAALLWLAKRSRCSPPS